MNTGRVAFLPLFFLQNFFGGEKNEQEPDDLSPFSIFTEYADHRAHLDPFFKMERA
jgi:hypothetical protein